MFWDNLLTTARWVFTAALFIVAVPVIIYAALWLLLGGVVTKLGGLGLLALGFAMWTFGLWLALGRPRDWFRPGENTDFNPRR